MALDFTPRPGKSASGYEIRNYPTTGATPGRYGTSFPTVSGQLPMHGHTAVKAVTAPVGARDKSTASRGRRTGATKSSDPALKNVQRKVVSNLGPL